MTSEEDARNVIAALHGEPVGERTFSFNFADEKKIETPTNTPIARLNKSNSNELCEPHPKLFKESVNSMQILIRRNSWFRPLC
jgi:hypothetical protein